jgi:hypothetical protein
VADWPNIKYYFQSVYRIIFPILPFCLVSLNQLSGFVLKRCPGFSPLSRDFRPDHFMGVESSCGEWQSDISFKLAPWDLEPALNDMQLVFC